jgi:hypothetical protein
MTGAATYALLILIALALVALLGIDFDPGGYTPRVDRWSYWHAALSFVLVLAALGVFNAGPFTLHPVVAVVLTLAAGIGWEIVPRRRRYWNGGGLARPRIVWERPFADPGDVGFDALGVALGVLVWFAVRWL